MILLRDCHSSCTDKFIVGLEGAFPLRGVITFGALELQVLTVSIFNLLKDVIDRNLVNHVVDLNDFLGLVAKATKLE
jgi:hypothetical protein